MSNCCSSEHQVNSEHNSVCSSCNKKAKSVKLITLKSMLVPSALETLNAEENYFFCSTKDCDVVYFNTNDKKYLTSDIKEVVHQKDDSLSTPICYCFGWTKENIKYYLENELSPNPLAHIRENIQEKRCGCEVNNPQGSCCLGNVTKYIKELS
ncbi:putative iron-sulfur cluster-binding metallochaperone [Bacillus massiliigorillae]|uniref:putative iron-sulfur cluster-binding metallochaperone n=1 Tax=Bacillus massiliigorillae TaxID=1243664 RepID=UPI0003A91ACF|nr:copper chaperone Copz family protein [Bacillus massiliigorillae]